MPISAIPGTLSIPSSFARAASFFSERTSTLTRGSAAAMSLSRPSVSPQYLQSPPSREKSVSRTSSFMPPRVFFTYALSFSLSIDTAPPPPPFLAQADRQNSSARTAVADIR